MKHRGKPSLATQEWRGFIPTSAYASVANPEPADVERFAGGNPITATAAGDTEPAFTVSTAGVALMQTDLPCRATSRPVLTWRSAGPPSAGTIA